MRAHVPVVHDEVHREHCSLNLLKRMGYHRDRVRNTPWQTWIENGASRNHLVQGRAIDLGIKKRAWRSRQKYRSIITAEG